MSYYHYTKGCHLKNIIKDGKIETSKVLLEKHEKPAVWLSKSPVWESACNIGQVINHENLLPGKVYSSKEVDSVTVSDGYMKKEIGMCRILIKETLPVITWAKYKYVGRISEKWFTAQDTYSRSIGCPVDKWICSFSPIRRDNWESIEMFVDDQWVRWDEKMPIQEFVDLCLSCNGKQIAKEEKINGFPKVHCQNQLDFINKYNDEIIDCWEANKHKKGYVEIFITPDYKPYPCGFRFIEKRVRKSTFKPLLNSENENYALVHFLWEATFTQYKVALAYENELCGRSKSK